MISTSAVGYVIGPFGRVSNTASAARWGGGDDPPFFRSGDCVTARAKNLDQKKPLAVAGLRPAARGALRLAALAEGATMTLPLFQFRDRLGEVVNLSAAEARDEISKAELYHIVDVGKGLWCRPCQSTGCAHATQIEQVLATAGLGTPRTGPYHELPGIARITRYCAVGETVVECWFDNGGRLRVHERRDGGVVQSVFTPEKAREPTEMSEKPNAESAPACLIQTLATYCQYRQIGDLDGLRQRYPEMAHVVGEADAATQTDGKP